MYFLKLFLTFAQVGLFGFGGGYAILTIIQGACVNDYHWLTMGEFTDIVAISQMTPGPIGVNSATFIGYSATLKENFPVWVAVVVSLLTTVAMVLPSFFIMAAVSRVLMRFKSHPIVQHVFLGLRPAVVGLIAAASLLLLNEENFSTPAHPWQFWCSLLIFGLTFIASHTYKMSPIRLFLCSAVAGILLF